MSATKKTRIVRPTPSTIRLDDGEVLHVGVDAHKATYHVALLSDRRGLLANWVQPAQPELLAERLTPLREAIAQVVYEAGPTGFALVRRLRADGFHADVIAPAKTPVTPGAEPKTDRLDCCRLAVFAQKGLLQPVRVPTEQEEADRQVLRLRELSRAERHRPAVADSDETSDTRIAQTLLRLTGLTGCPVRLAIG